MCWVCPTSGTHLVLGTGWWRLWLLLPSSSLWFAFAEQKEHSRCSLTSDFLQDFFIVLLLIWMSWPDSSASNYILSVWFSLLFPLQMLFVTTCKSGTAVVFLVHIWVMEKKTVNGVQKEFAFLFLRSNITLIIWFWGSNKKKQKTTTFWYDKSGAKNDMQKTLLAMCSLYEFLN